MLEDFAMITSFKKYIMIGASLFCFETINTDYLMASQPSETPQSDYKKRPTMARRFAGKAAGGVAAVPGAATGAAKGAIVGAATGAVAGGFMGAKRRCEMENHRFNNNRCEDFSLRKGKMGYVTRPIGAAAGATVGAAGGALGGASLGLREGAKKAYKGTKRAITGEQKR